MYGSLSNCGCARAVQAELRAMQGLWPAGCFDADTSFQEDCWIACTPPSQALLAKTRSWMGAVRCGTGGAPVGSHRGCRGRCLNRQASDERSLALCLCRSALKASSSDRSLLAQYILRHSLTCLGSGGRGCGCGSGSSTTLQAATCDMQAAGPARFGIVPNCPVTFLYCCVAVLPAQPKD